MILDFIYAGLDGGWADQAAVGTALLDSYSVDPRPDL
jgi:hypothetical protein